ncbi:MAG: hypothetical protein EOO56_16370, partial [Hymenobacter sp.]
MGVDLVSILNHRIPFEGKTLAEIIAIIQPKLNAMELDNRGFLRQYTSAWAAATPPQRLTLAQSTRWQPLIEDPRYYDFDTAAYKTIDFEGPYNLRVSFDPHAIYSFSPPYRYRQWFGLQNEDGTEATAVRNEWRRYLRQVARTFGGDRALYLADNAHPLTTYWYEDKAVEAIEQQMRAELG